jgi:hypothetical protein
MILVRYILIGLIIYLIVRSFLKYGGGDGHSVHQNAGNKKSQITKKISKETGEYIDYEEIRK